MAINIRSLINNAYQSIGMISIDDVVNGNEANIGVIELNEALAQLNTDQLFPFQQNIVDFNISSSKIMYTIGQGVDNLLVPTADINMQRPICINQIYYSSNSLAAPYRVSQISIEDLYNRRAITSIGAPGFFSYNPKYPNGEIIFNIKPQEGALISIFYTDIFPEVTIDSVLDVDNAYRELIKYALARKLASLNQMPNDTVANVDTLYKQALTRIKTMNSRNKTPVFDLEFRDITSDNILTG